LICNDVAFEYVAGRPVLSGVSFEVVRGEAIGIVGPSGGGKTTLTEILLKLRQPTAGRVVVNGGDLQHITPDSWARLVALVPQGNELILGTIFENIRFYRDGFSDSDIVQAATAAHLHDEISELPSGYETMVGPGARNMSGGQRQRLGIARALLGRPELLILDEPTSALDHNSEELIRQTLAELKQKGESTLLLVAHRPATLDVCNRFLMVEGGIVKEAKESQLAHLREFQAGREGLVAEIVDTSGHVAKGDAVASSIPEVLGSSRVGVEFPVGTLGDRP
jgi:ABC-type bacteriocin/lantibiotic exporter with double-glycine peptidase domain